MPEQNNDENRKTLKEINETKHLSDKGQREMEKSIERIHSKPLVKDSIDQVVLEARQRREMDRTPVPGRGRGRMRSFANER